MGFATRFPREAEHLVVGERRPTISDLRELQRTIFRDREAADGDAPAVTSIIMWPESCSGPRGPSWCWALGPWLATLAALALLWANVTFGLHR